MKGQSGFEVLIAISLVLILLIFSIIAYVTKRGEVDFTREHIEAQTICFEIKNVINQIFSDGPGANLPLNVSSKLEDNDFNVTVNSPSRSISVEWKGNVFSCTMVVQNVTNSTFSKIFNIKSGTSTIKNVEGVVVIEP